MTACVSVGRRVVVTGIGLVTCLGVGVEHVWRRLLRGDSGITHVKIREFENTKIPCTVAGHIPRGSSIGDLNMEQLYSTAEQREMSTMSLYALEAAREALKMAKWDSPSLTEEGKLETGVAVGSGMVGLDDIYEVAETLYKQGYRKVDPRFVPRILINIPAGLISMKYGFQGPNHAVSTACTTGLHATGDAFRFIKYGDANVMVCGGTEACISPIGLAGFAKMRALSTKFNDTPHKASRPFDESRDGFVMSEGAGIMVLEELEHAKARGVDILAEVKGYGLSGEAHHISSPTESGRGAELCMTKALHEAKVDISEIGYINAHATSTPVGDAAELRAISRVFGNNKLAISSTKGAVGHLLGAAGSVESIFTILALKTRNIPFNTNLQNEDKEFKDLNLVKGEPQLMPSGVTHAVTNSFGFGGTNASLCLASYNSHTSQ
ncbi:unnamed protein product [Owenia fusiformis]|uniref:3-oxoacyl-[acyl-carrier-protein] synthase n=1 Tax=Owenia fusiformis TaxID=6347 RepID=A0A8J1UDM3_OWEFU|nr:unnamed protein product [Owenia fusiformis]